MTRTMGYDSLGRMIENFERSTSEGTLEDYSPCEVHHVPYSPAISR